MNFFPGGLKFCVCSGRLPSPAGVCVLGAGTFIYDSCNPPPPPPAA